VQQIFLSQFRASNSIPSFNQTELNKAYVKFLSIAACINEKVSSKEKANQILLDLKQKMKSYGVKPHYIARRKAAILPQNYFDGDLHHIKLPSIYENLHSEPRGNTIINRIKQHANTSLNILNNWFKKDDNLNGEIKLVTSSVYESPNALQRFISAKNLNVRSSHTYGNDCYAAFPAIEQATGSICNPYNKVENVTIAHIELNSFHVNIADTSAENLIKMSLFGDGAICYKVNKQETANSLQVLKIEHQLIPNSTDQMTWQPGPFNYEMTLKPFVPLFINDNILPFLNKLFLGSENLLEECIKNAIWAIHPGGPKIVHFIKDKLSLSDEQVEFSYQILKENGNMSSTTLPYIWQKIIDEKSIVSGQMVISLAFGPGLTVYGMIMKKI